MTVLVTGANGFLGANLVRALLARGEKVRALTRHDSPALAGLDIEEVRGDIRDPQSFRDAMNDIETVFHLAAIISIDGPHGGLVRATNVDGARNVAEAALAAGVGRFVHVSSVHAFDQAPLDQPLDESRPRVGGPGHPAYDLSKAAGEAAIRDVIGRGLDAVIINPTGVIGPFDYAPSAMGRVFIDLYRRKVPALVNGGFNWVDVRDVAAGMLAAAERGRTGENYILPGHWLSVRGIVDLAASIAGVAPPRLVMPMTLARAVAPFALGFARLLRQPPRLTGESLSALRGNRDVRGNKAEAELGYRPRPIAETVADIYRWYAEAGVVEPNAKLKAMVAN
jgi:dihydroflavonol-4-reductase